jgi:hypothetical protein
MLAHHTGEKSAHRMLLPSRGFHDGSNRCALGPPQQAKDGLLFGVAAGRAPDALTLRRSRCANLAACRLRFSAFVALQHFEILSIVTALGAVTAEAPQWQRGRRGGIPNRAEGSMN